MKKTVTREQFKKLAEDYRTGKRGIMPGHPKEIEVAVKTFLETSFMLLDYPEIEHIPPEYVENLIKTFSKYPEYHGLMYELVNIINNR